MAPLPAIIDATWKFIRKIHVTGQAGLGEKSPKSGAPAGPSCARTQRSHRAAACSGCMPGGAAAPGPAATRRRRRRRCRPRAAPPRCAAKTRRRPAPWRPCAGSLGCWRPPGRSAAGQCAHDPNVNLVGVRASQPPCARRRQACGHAGRAAPWLARAVRRRKCGMPIAQLGTPSAKQADTCQLGCRKWRDRPWLQEM